MEITTPGDIRNESSFHQGICYYICGVYGIQSKRSQREIRQSRDDITGKIYKTEKKNRFTRVEIKTVSSKSDLPRDNTREVIVSGLNIAKHQ